MPAEIVTEKLKLNQWQGNEYPKRQDFVDDNKKIDDFAKSIDEVVKKYLTAEQAGELYAKLNHKHDASDINDLSNYLLDSTVGNSNKLNNLTDIDFVKQMLAYDNQNSKTITREIFNNASYNNAYIGDINYGTEVGLPVHHNKIIYLPHRNIGYGTQIAIPFEGGHFTTMYIRNAVGATWGKWNDMRLAGNAENNAYTNTYNANTATESGKLYYCVYNQCQNLPRGTIDDGILIAFMHRTDILFGFQFYMTWNNDELWTRNINNGSFSHWRCLSNGKWNFAPENDTTTIGRLLRWSNYGTNHVIFDASSTKTPSNGNCNNINPDVVWSPSYPTLMGFNGLQTYGVRVDSARTTEQVQGFQFRNNNGQLEVLVGGVWLSVGAKQYTVTRQFYLRDNSQERFDYSGGSGILRFIKYPKAPNIEPTMENFNTYYTHLPEIFIDGVSVDNMKYPIFGELEFKNSISIIVQNWSGGGNYGCYGLIQTEK